MDEANRLAAAKLARSVVKGSRLLLQPNRENIDPGDRVRLAELLRANRAFAAVYLPKDDLKQLWQFKYEASARKLSEGWYRWAMRSRTAPPKKLAQTLKWKLDGVFSHCRRPLHTVLLEGVNNKIKDIKR